MPISDFNEQVAVVTGAASGIGRALAEALAQRGARLVLADVEQAPLEALSEALSKAGTPTLAVLTDVSRRESVQALASKAFAQFKQVHLLFNNAGVGVGGPLQEARQADWEWVLGVNLWGVIHGIEAFVPAMLRQQKPGHVINTASMAGLIASKDLGVYNASKAAVVSLSETLAKDLRETPLGVTVVCPMGVQTRITESERNRPAHLGNSAEAVPELLGRWLPPEVVAEQILSAVLADEPYVVTHYEGADFWRRRADRIQAAFPPPPQED